MLKNYQKRILLSIVIVVGVLGIASFAFYLSTYHPKQIESMPVVSSGAEPMFVKGQKIKVLCWNVQFMAGKNYVFFFDEWDESGPDVRPSSEDIAITFEEVVRIIKDENPDIILLQELDSKAKRTDKEDQLARLIEMLPAEYSAYTSAWYWKALFVPHPKIMGSVGMQLAVISKYKMDSAVRYQLPLMPNNVIVRNLQFKRALLEAVFPVEGGTSFSAFSIHQDAFAQGSNTMQEQVNLVSSVLSQKEEQGGSWLIGGDFNLLPPGDSYARLPDYEKPYFQPESEIARLFDEFIGYPSLDDMNGEHKESFYTHWPNYGTKEDRTIDYYFTGKNIEVTNYYVRQHDTTLISDHFPFLMECVLP